MRRRIGLTTALALFMSLAMAAQAWSQGAILQAPATAVRGTTITVTGAGYSGSSAAIASGIDIRLDTRDADPLNNSPVTPQGTFSISVPIPALTPLGEHLLIGTQVTTRGRHVFGAPGRTKLVVTAASSAAEALPTSSPSHPPPAALGAGLLALLVLTGGIVFCVRRLRSHSTRTQPQAAR